MSSFDDFLGTMEIREIRDIRENLFKPLLPPHRAIPTTRLNEKSRMSRISCIGGADPYDAEEREAIQLEAEQPPFDDPTGCAGVLGFDDCTPITNAQRFAMNMQLLKGGKQ